MSSTATVATWWRLALDPVSVTRPRMKVASPVKAGLRYWATEWVMEAPLAGPGRDVVQDPGAHRGAVAVAAGHADVLGPPGLKVAS